MGATEIKNRFYSFSGRIGRQSYWLGMLAIIAFVMVFVFLVSRVPVALMEPPTAKALFYIFFAGLVLWPVLAMTVKRLHDRNKSAWWLIPFHFVPTWLENWNDKLLEGTPLWWATLAGVLVLSLWYLIETGFLKGNEGANDYGVPETPTKPSTAQ